MDERLPEGWVRTTIGDVCLIERGITFPSSAKSDINTRDVIACLRTANVQNSVNWDNLIYIPKSYLKDQSKRVALNDILISMANSRELVGKVSFVDQVPIESTFGAFISVIRAIGEMHAKFLFYYFRLGDTNHRLKQTATQTVNIANLSLDAIYTTDISLPPLAEQTRIVAAIEQQFTRIDAAVARLQSARAKTRQYRASLLKAAVEGELTREWREEYPTGETGAQLLARILAERRARWEEKRLAEMLAKGKPPKDDIWKLEYKEPQAPDVKGLPGLPERWCWATVEQVSSLVTDGDHNPPQRVKQGIPHLTAKNIVNSQIDFKGCTFITEEDAQRVFLRYKPLVGDLLITCVGTLGRTAIVPDTVVFSPDRNLAAIRTVIGADFTKYLEYCLLSPDFQTTLTRASGSTAQPHLYLADLRSLPFPLPPLAEQTQIVAEVEAKLSDMAQVEVAIENNLKRAEQERQSILREAFAGRLVEQDAGDEPASVLLERIQEERARREIVEKTRRKEVAMDIAKKRRTKKAVIGEQVVNLYGTLVEAGQPLPPDDLFYKAGLKTDEQPESVEVFYEALIVDAKDELIEAIKDDRPDERHVLLNALEPSEEMLARMVESKAQAQVVRPHMDMPTLWKDE